MYKCPVDYLSQLLEAPNAPDTISISCALNFLLLLIYGEFLMNQSYRKVLIYFEKRCTPIVIHMLLPVCCSDDLVLPLDNDVGVVNGIVVAVSDQTVHTPCSVLKVRHQRF